MAKFDFMPSAALPILVSTSYNSCPLLFSLVALLQVKYQAAAAVHDVQEKNAGHQNCNYLDNPKEGLRLAVALVVVLVGDGQQTEVGL